jgi:2-C-methyl-D-erythritol 2,4-cyclodiphosphate synthase
MSAKRKLFLGGVLIPYPKGLIGHSDADCLLHAICDAILGAMGKGDIGHHFPNTDPKYKNISSLELLKQVHRIAKKGGFGIVNVDVMVLLEAPKIGPYKEKIEKKIAGILKINKNRISVKATTHEGIGAIGEQKAAAAYAVVLVRRSP